MDQMLYQIIKLPKSVADRELGGLTAMIKAEAGIVLKDCADCAVLLFGEMDIHGQGRESSLKVSYIGLLVSRAKKVSLTCFRTLEGGSRCEDSWRQRGRSHGSGDKAAGEEL